MKTIKHIIGFILLSAGLVGLTGEADSTMVQIICFMGSMLSMYIGYQMVKDVKLS